MAVHDAAVIIISTSAHRESCFLRSTSGEVNNDIVVEMKTDKANEEAGLLNKRPPAGQVRLFTRATVQNCELNFFYLTPPRRILTTQLRP